jgi:hypothetical protein
MRKGNALYSACTVVSAVKFDTRQIGVDLGMVIRQSRKSAGRA